MSELLCRRAANRTLGGYYYAHLAERQGLMQNPSHGRGSVKEKLAEWRQGVALRIEGKFKVNGQIIRRGIVLWQDTAPQTVDLKVIGKVSTIEVKNVWDVGNGVIHSWHNGAAMIVETLPNGRRYRCNDGLADDDFDDIVFHLERVG